jgi:hypothetical protein
MITQLPNYWFVADAMPLPLFDMLLLVLNSASRIPCLPCLAAGRRIPHGDWPTFLWMTPNPLTDFYNFMDVP